MQNFFLREKADIENNDLKETPYVSRGGFKIEHAFTDLDLSVRNKNAIDVGASTGGFTDFLLRNGAKHVVTIDVGYGILAWKLRTDPRVIVFDRTNIRYFNRERLPFLSDFTVVDVSFISIKTVFHKLLEITKEDGGILILLKPQFELEKDEVEKGGIIKSKNLHAEIIKRTFDFTSKLKLKLEGITFSKLKGAKGNIEFWLYYKKDFIKSRSSTKKTVFDYDKIISATVDEAHAFFKQAPAVKDTGIKR